MTDTDLLAAAEQWAHVEDYPLPDGYEGIYIPDDDLILLNTQLSPIQRRCVLAHEISHAKHHDHSCHADQWTEQRADMDASALLINPVEYAMAEAVYGQNTHGIAVELGVMPWVVDAYRQRLHNNPQLAIL